MLSLNEVNLTFINKSPDGIIRCTIGYDWLGVVYKIPRSKLDDCKTEKELDYSGIYLLLDNPENGKKGSVYVGQADLRINGQAIQNRLQEHTYDRYKDFWTEAIAVTTRDNSLGPTELCYLEPRLFDIITEAKNYTLRNGKRPSAGNSLTGKTNVLENFIDYTKFITGLLGYEVFDKLTDTRNTQPTAKSQKTSNISEITFYLEPDKKNKTKRATIKHIRKEDFTVLADSYINTDTTESLNEGYKSLRTEYAHLINKDNKLVEDIIFKSASAASSFILGRNSNGNTDLKTADGKPLKDV
ncbi:MAG: GIY-YIG nuclease family protein [Prevotella sp.]|jgi:hypothetical protein|nr:GIY-YIG nuclease family protein [Prevotella sp.]